MNVVQNYSCLVYWAALDKSVESNCLNDDKTPKRQKDTIAAAAASAASAGRGRRVEAIDSSQTFPPLKIKSNHTLSDSALTYDHSTPIAVHGLTFYKFPNKLCI